MNDRWQNLLTGVLTVCAVIVTILVVRREFFVPPPSTASAREVREIDDWRRLVASGHVMGNHGAQVKIVEFVDYQCPFCRRAENRLDDVLEKHLGEVAVVLFHRPLERTHPHAFEAAVAAQCAGAQGAFRRFHDALFRHQDSIGAWDWSRFGRVAELDDLEAFTRCMEEERLEDRVREHIRIADSLKVRSTPTFIVDGRLFSGANPPEQTWSQLVDSVLQEE